MTGWLIVLAAALVFAGVISWWHWLDRKHMRDSIRETSADAVRALKEAGDPNPRAFLRDAMRPRAAPTKPHLVLMYGQWWPHKNPRRHCPANPATYIEGIIAAHHWASIMNAARAHAAASIKEYEHQQALRDITWSDS